MKKFTFTTLHSVDGGTGATVEETSGIPFGWGISYTYTIKVVTNNGYITESPYSSSATHA